MQEAHLLLAFAFFPSLPQEQLPLPICSERMATMTIAKKTSSTIAVAKFMR